MRTLKTANFIRVIIGFKGISFKTIFLFLYVSRIKSVGLNYRKSTGLLTKSESLLQAGKSFLTGDFGSLINQGKEAFGKIKGDVVNWYHKNEAIINNIATIALEGLAAIGTVAAIAAGAYRLLKKYDGDLEIKIGANLDFNLQKSKFAPNFVGYQLDTSNVLLLKLIIF